MHPRTYVSISNDPNPSYHIPNLLRYKKPFNKLHINHIRYYETIAYKKNFIQPVEHNKMISGSHTYPDLNKCVRRLHTVHTNRGMHMYHCAIYGIGLCSAGGFYFPWCPRAWTSRRDDENDVFIAKSVFMVFACAIAWITRCSFGFVIVGLWCVLTRSRRNDGYCLLAVWGVLAASFGIGDWVFGSVVVFVF